MDERISTEARHHVCARDEGRPILRGKSGLSRPARDRSIFEPRCENGPPQVLLLADAEFVDYVLVALGIVALEVVEQATTLADHHQETATGGVILLVRLEMVRQLTDSLAEHCDLDLGAARVLLVGAEPGNDVCFTLSS